jgi:hypothetical protein
VKHIAPLGPSDKACCEHLRHIAGRRDLDVPQMGARALKDSVGVNARSVVAAQIHMFPEGHQVAVRLRHLLWSNSIRKGLFTTAGNDDRVGIELDEKAVGGFYRRHQGALP